MSSSLKTPKIVFLAGINHDNGTYTKYVGEKYRQFREAYRSLFDLFAQQAVKVYFAEITQLTIDGSFAEYFEIDTVTEDAIIFRKITSPILPDIIINRVKDALYTHPAAKNHPWKIYNEYEVAKYGDKSISQQLLANFMPESLVVNTTSAHTTAIDEFFTRHDTAVMKPLRLNGGQGIELIHSADDVRAYHAQNPAADAVLQEFIETSSGVPGLISDRHDVRLYVIDGQVQMMAVRQPRQGDFLANTAAGGSISFYGLASVPRELLDLTDDVMRHLPIQTQHYFISLDFFCGNAKWYLIEVNDQPGVPANYQTSEAARLHDSLVSSIMGYVA